MKQKERGFMVYMWIAIALLIFLVIHPVGPIGIDVNSDRFQSIKESMAGNCSGETKVFRRCLPGFKQACVSDIVCKCNDDWKFTASALDGCVIWSGKDIPNNVTRYAFPDECRQICRGSSSLRAE